jgi:hypothetical protein
VSSRLSSKAVLISGALHKEDFVALFEEWLARSALSDEAAAELLEISVLRVHMYRTGMFSFIAVRELIILGKIGALQIERASSAAA